MSFDEALRRRIPLGVAADYFIGLKKVAQPPALGGAPAPGGGASMDNLSGPAYMDTEGAALAAQNAEEAQYYRARLQEATAQLQMAQQQIQASGEQAAQLQQQVDQSQAQIQAAQQGEAAARDEATNAQQMAANMRMAHQKLRGDLMSTISSQPPPEEPAPTPEEAAAAPAPQPGAPPPEGMPPEGAPPQGAPPGGAPPPAPPPGGAPPAPTKQASALLPMLKQRLPHALVGSALLGTGVAIESSLGTEGIKQDIAEAEAKEKSFGRALQLARLKMRLAGRELSTRHPAAATATGAALGAIIGGGAGPGVVRNIRTIRRNLLP